MGQDDGMARHTYRCPMRWSDMDAYGHVNNVVFLTYLEEARVDMLDVLKGASGHDQLEEGILVSRHEIAYKRPLVHHLRGVDIDLWVGKIGGASFDIHYEVHDETQVFATASSTLVPYDFIRSRPRRLTSEERAFLEKYVP
jgi:acyl-CoA thioester hydrolase